MRSRMTSSIIKRQTVTGAVADELRRRIVVGEYKGGDQIRQEAVAMELGVSRIPVREALLQLEAEGLVAIHTHRGAIVASLSVDDAIDLFEARALLEPMIVRRAAELAEPDDIARIQASLDRYEKAVRDDVSPNVLSALNWELHTALCEPARRPRTVQMLLSLYTATDRYLRLQIRRPDAKTQALEDHRAIFDAYRQRKGATVARLVRRHITSAYNDVIRRLNHDE